VRVLFGTGLRLIVIVALVAAVAIAPTLFVYRSRCRSAGHIEARWRVSLPGHQQRLPRCGRPEQGLHYLLRKVGLI
jgi:hypothetical protein